MREQSVSEPRQVVYVVPDLSAWVGRILGGLVVVAGLALGFKAAADAGSDPFWAFLAASSVTTVIGVLTLVAAEGLNRLSRQ